MSQLNDQLFPLARRRAGLGDALDQYSDSPSFMAKWATIEKQLQAEGQAFGYSPSAILDNIAGAKVDYANTYGQLLTQAFNSGSVAGQGVEADLANAASTLIHNKATVLGAVNAVEGLVNAAEHGTPQQIVQSFAGVLFAASAVLGAVSFGVGAVICTGIAIALDLIAGLLGSSPPVGQIGNCTINQGGTMPRWTVGFTFPTWTPYNPPLDGPQNPKWRHFPVGTRVRDAWWFTPQSGSASFGQAGWFTTTWDSGGTTEEWNACGGPGPRPIDAAFSQYHQLECDIIYANATLALDAWQIGEVAVALANFTKAYFAAWTANQEFAFNGLGGKLPSDADVLVQVQTTWNSAHAPGVGYDIAAPVNGVSSQAISWDTHCSTTSPAKSYVHLLVGDLSSSQSRSLTNGALHINTGARLVPPNTLSGLATASATSAPMSTGSKVAIGGVVAVGGGLAAAAVYSFVTRQALGVVLDKLWDKTGGRAVSSVKKSFKR